MAAGGSIAGGSITASPTLASAEEDKSGSRSTEDLPSGVSENPGNEIELIEVSRNSSPKSDGVSINSHGETIDETIPLTANIPNTKYELGLDVIIYDWDKPACNYELTGSLGKYTASAQRIHCEGDSELTLDFTVASLSVRAESFNDSLVDEKLKLTGEVCVGGWRFEECYDLSWTFYAP